jgi:hypothetical protein
MKKLLRNLTLIALAAAATAFPSAVRADDSGDLDNINPYYHGGALLQHVQVSNLFMGQEWQGSQFPNYLNGFFKALFDDGRYMANLSQYSAGSYQIGNGQFVGAAWYQKAVGGQVTDDQVRATIAAGIQAKALPKPNADSLYVVFTPPNTEVIDATGTSSVDTFYGYHGYVSQSAVGAFAYAIVVFPDDGWHLTPTASHEMSEAVTDPQVNAGTLGWYDDNNGELGDIPVSLYYAGRIAETDELDILVGGDGTKYIVQKEWSVRDGAPVAFAESAR